MNTIKAISKYILRVLVFLALAAQLFEISVEFQIELLSSTIGLLITKLLNIFLDNSILSQLTDFSLIVYFIFSFIFTAYFLAKICGIFKKLNILKKYQSFSIILSISIASWNLGLQVQNNQLSTTIEDNLFFTALALVPAYILYLFFSFLTKKYPNPFEKIGYYSSLEFYKELFKNLKSGIKKEG